MTNTAQQNDLANAIRSLAMDAVEKANSGHPGLPMGCADIATVLFTKVMKFDPADSLWPDRDRFVLSAGHGSMLLYSSLYLLGYEDMTIDQVKNFRQLGSKTAGHPEHGHSPRASKPPPARSARASAMPSAWRSPRPSSPPNSAADIVDHHTWCLAGDGCLMEGISQEAIALAGHLKLNKLTLIWDNNSITIDGAVSNSDSTDQIARFKAVGWNTIEIDGHDQAAIEAALLAVQEVSDKPDPDRRQDHDRLWRPQEGRHREGARLPARRRGTGRRQGRARHHLPRLRNPRRNAGHLARRRHPQPEHPRRMAVPPCRFRQQGRIRAPHRRHPARRLRPRPWTPIKSEAERRQAQGRHPQVRPDGARRHQCRRARNPGRLGRSHRLQPDQYQGNHALHRRRPLPAAT